MPKATLMSFLMLALSYQAQAIEPLSWHAVIESETQNMRCSDMKPPSEKDMKSFLEARINDPEETINQTVLGIHFKHENPEMIKWFRGIHEISDLKRDDAESVQLKNTTCDKVVCALEKNYGNGLALRMLYIYAKYGLPTSPLLLRQYASYQNWTGPELDDVMVGLEATPPAKIPFKNRNLLRVRNGYAPNKSAGENLVVVANSSMEYFDQWAKQSSLNRIRTVIHEIGHIIADNNLDVSPEWRSIPLNQISEYAQTNSAEGFAESYVAYRIAPKKMKKNAPEAYAFLNQKVFAGLEFKTSADCEESFAALSNETSKILKIRWQNSEWALKNKTEINEELVRIEKYGVLTDLAMQYCSHSYLAEKTGGDREDTMKCLEAVFKKRAAVLKARQEGREDITFENILRSHLQDISVPRVVILSLREQLRNQVQIELKTFYSQRHLNLSNDMEFALIVTRSENEGDSAFIRGNRDLVIPIILEAFKRESQKSLIRRTLFSPSFSSLIP